MNLRELLATAKKHAETENLAAIEALRHLAEIERRRAFVLLGYPTLWEYALKEMYPLSMAKNFQPNNLL